MGKIDFILQSAEMKVSHDGRLCPACLERTPIDVPKELLVFACGKVDKNMALIGHRLQICAKALEKRPVEFLQQKDNCQVCCCPTCKGEYEEFWKKHPKRADLIAKLERSFSCV